jgi:tRNA A-37 threonylcarbamoyl transferase component Bud32
VEEALVLGRYRPLAEIGEGGHGAVDLAFDTKMARRVAIKRIPVSHRGIEILSRTTGLKEARTAALLNHPNVVTVYEWDTDDDEAFLIMEHVDGASLEELLAEFAPMNADEAASVLSQTADAVAFAHENGVLHLDLKPDNVLVTRDGLVKVGDFGVAALTNAAGQAISAGGTLGYMPPEQLRGEDVDVRTDVWAFAAVAFQVLTGAVPFAAKSIEGALFKAERTGVPSPREFVRELPPDIDAILMDALSADPEDRPETLRELADDLLECLGDTRTGRAQLGSLVEQLVAEEEPDEEDESVEQLGLWDRLAYRSDLGTRLACVAAASWLAWSGAVAVGFGAGPGAVALLFAAVIAYFAPMLGLGAGIVLLSAGAFATSPWIGVGVSVVGALWWYFVARPRPSVGAVPVFAPLAGVLRLSPALPVLAGFFLSGLWEAAAAGAMSGLVLAVVSLAGGSASLTDVAWPALIAPLAAPGPGTFPELGTILRAGAITLAWALAALATSAGARRGTRAGALAGAVVGLALCGAAIGPWMTGGSQMDAGALVQIGLASILVLAVIAAGPPVRGADEDDREA